MIYVRLGKGGKDRGVPLPKTLAEKLNTQLGTVRRIHTADLAEGFGEAWLPEGFARKMGPGARDLGWQYLFPAKKRSVDPRSGQPPGYPSCRWNAFPVGYLERALS